MKSLVVEPDTGTIASIDGAGALRVIAKSASDEVFVKGTQCVCLTQKEEGY